MKNRGYLETFSTYLCASLLLPSALALADPLNLTLPKTAIESGLRIFSVNQNTPTPAVSLVMSQIEKKIEQSVVFIPWPHFSSGKRVYGSVKVTITVQMDGTVMEIEPTSSGLVDGANQLLIEATTKTIESAAPFAPLPREHFTGFDAIRFSRTFNFGHGEKPVVN